MVTPVSNEANPNSESVAALIHRRWRLSIQTIVLIALDGVLIALALYMAVLLRNVMAGHWLAKAFSGHVDLIATATWFSYGFCLLVWLGALLYEGVYSTDLKSFDKLDQIVKALSGGLLFAILLTFVIHRSDTISRAVLGTAYVECLLLFALGRPVLVRGLSTVLPMSKRPVLVDPANAAGFVPTLCRAGLTVHQLGGYDSDEAKAFDGVPLVALGPKLDTRFLTQLEVKYGEIGFLLAPNSPTIFGAIPVNLYGMQLYVISHPLSRMMNRVIKRTIDVVGGLVLLALLSPVLLAIIVLIRFESPGPIFFGHKRFGYRGNSFRMWKFRTMVINAEERLQEVLAQNPELRKEFEAQAKLKNDPRITRIGKFLRRYSMDELPQLWNVVTGDMSLVGPRPIYLESEIEKFAELYPIMSSVRPGMTGLWQTSGRSDTSYQSRRDFDLYYVRRWSLWLDVAILMRTVLAVAMPGAY